MENERRTGFGCRRPRSDIEAARAIAYQRAEQIQFEGKHCRSDIALKALV